MKLFDDEYYTHMPFIFEGQLLHCKAKERSWYDDTGDKLAASKYRPYDIYCSDLDGANSFYIGADLGERVIACSPNAFRNSDGLVVLNYVAAAISPESTQYFHYQRIGKTLQSLGDRRQVKEPHGIPNKCQMENERFTYSVFHNGSQSCFLQYDKKLEKQERFDFAGITHLTRIATLGEHFLVITYVDTEHTTRSGLYDLRDGTLQEINAEGQPLYKSHVHDDFVYFSKRAPGDVYGMSIHKNHFTLGPTSVKCVPFSTK